MSDANIKEVVKEKYGQAALRVFKGGSTCCGAAPAAEGCPDPISSNLDDGSQASEIPEAALLASLGCGNPTALAELKPGETVLDLGSGGGIDVLLSAKRVGPAGNSARSQMAEGLLRQDGGAPFEVASAATKPSHVRPEAIAAMREIGIDISTHRSKFVDEFAGQAFDYVITVCDNARESCPVFSAATKRIHWSLDDPAAVQGTGEQRLVEFRRVRDQLRTLLREFVQESR
jgi:arsenate reductase